MFNARKLNINHFSFHQTRDGLRAVICICVSIIIYGVFCMIARIASPVRCAHVKVIVIKLCVHRVITLPYASCITTPLTNVPDNISPEPQHYIISICVTMAMLECSLPLVHKVVETASPRIVWFQQFVLG